MGTGVAVRVCSPGSSSRSPRAELLVYQLAAAGSCSDLFSGVPVWGGVVNAAKRSSVSTGQLRRLPALHTRPIDPVVFREPSATRARRPRLAGGFTLRCLQRLSGPDVATQRCR